MKAELHIHSNQGLRVFYAPFLYDSIMTAEEIVDECLKQEIKILAISDHDTLAGSRQAAQIVKEKKLGILVISSCEVSSREGHILAYNINTEIPKWKSAKETVERIHDQGGIAVAAHPYQLNLGVGDKIRELDFDAIETWNSSVFHYGNKKSIQAAKEINKPGIAGSDAHWRECVGSGLTIFPEGTDTIEKFLRHLKKGNLKLETRKNDFWGGVPKYVKRNLAIQARSLL